MTGESLGLRTGSNGFLQQLQNGVTSQIHTGPALVRRPSKTLLHSREKERLCPFVCRLLGRRKVAVLLMVALALFVFVFGSLTSEKDIIREIQDSQYYALSRYEVLNPLELEEKQQARNYSSGSSSPRTRKTTIRPPSPPSSSHSTGRMGQFPTLGHPCDHFAIPPPPPSDRRRPGPRPCPVCYVPVEQAIASMPRFPSASPVLRTLTYVHDENPVNIESHGGSDFGGYPSLEDRDAAFDIKETMTVHCGFVKGSRPGHQTGFDIDEADILMLDEYHDIIVASGIFGNYDVIQQPKNISKEAKKHIPFYMFIDEETEIYMKNASILGSSKRVGLWRIIVIRNVPYADGRRNGKIPKLLLHRIFPNVRYSIWIDGKLQLVVDPYQILERFLWRTNSTFAISRHYRRFDVFVEAEANKAAGKYENASIDQQIQFYRNHDGLTHYSRAKLPITSDVPEGCVLIKEHVPITDLFTCLWFNEVDRFTSRDQLSFSTVRDKIMAKVDWGVNMFMDCERRNFVIQTYHRDLLEHMPPPAPPVRRLPSRSPPTPPHMNKFHAKKSQKRTRGDRRSSSKHHRKVGIVNV
ncbi:probable hexosyltransferase MUCI70 isoform X2 [Prosopis cineraria]|uniref:probable hexosyltransferase MUCI70 isoform X2 n=1 Tax=Prosopis cineraria TaxID=364024 RepID=UPI00240EB65C|nr:probable hexosyltransferase MUCI70 isoform X2 [Prosopis cineraria]